MKHFLRVIALIFIISAFIVMAAPTLAEKESYNGIGKAEYTVTTGNKDATLKISVAKGRLQGTVRSLLGTTRKKTINCSASYSVTVTDFGTQSVSTMFFDGAKYELEKNRTYYVTIEYITWEPNTLTEMPFEDTEFLKYPTVKLNVNHGAKIEKGYVDKSSSTDKGKKPSSSSNTAGNSQKQYAINYNGLAAWWAGSDAALKEYVSRMDSTYGRVENNATRTSSSNIIVGYEMEDWIDVIKQGSETLTYAPFIKMGYQGYDCEGKGVWPIESETLGWGGTDNAPTYRDEYYLFEVTSKDGVDTICIRMTNIGSTKVSVDGRMYASDSGESDEVVEEAVSDDTTDATEMIARESDTGSDTGFEDADFDTPEPHSLSTVEPVLYENSLYAEFNEFSDAQYRETVTMFDNNYGRTTMVIGNIDGSDVGALAMEYIGASTGQELLYGLLSYPFYEQGSSGIEDVLKSYSKISLVQSELYGWGYNNGRNDMVDEYYRFGILNDEGAEYAFYHVAFRIGYETDGGDWAEGRVLYLESIPKAEAAQVDTDYEPDTQEVYEEPVAAEEEDDINESYDYGLINGLLSEVEDEFFDRYSWDQLTLLGDIVYPDSDTSNLTVGGLLNTVGGIYSIVVDCGEYVDIRAEATHSSRSLQKAYQGQGIPVLGFWGDWAICVCENYNETYPVCGWIETRYLMDEEAAADADVYPEDYDSAPQNNDDDYYDNYDYEEYDYDSATGDDAAYYEDGAMEYLGTMVVGNCDEWVSLRESPDSNSGRLAEVYLGDTVEAYTFNQDWLICEYNGIWGYIKSMYLTLY